MKIKNTIIAITMALFPSLIFAQTHTIHFDKGVYQPTIKKWISSLAKISTVDSATYIRKKVGGKDLLHRTGHRDVIVWIPSTTNLAKDLKVIIWFHGHWGFVEHRTFQDRTLKQFVPHAQPGKSGKNFVVVIPEMPWSVHTRTPKKRNGQLWEKPGDFTNFIHQVERILLKHKINDSSFHTQLGNIDYRIVGHSAGGSTIATLGHTGDLCKINPSLVVWSDSSYGKWLNKAWDGCLGTARVPVEVFVRKGGSPWRNATRFMGEFQGQPAFLHLHVKGGKWSHKTIGNNIVELSGLLE